MKISAKIDYACRALLELCLHGVNSTPLQIGEIAKRQRIPIKFLTHILIQLKQMGYVDSIRGQKGGYLLIVPAAEIKLSDVIKSFGGLGYSIKEARKKTTHFHVIELIWQEIDAIVLNKLDEITFETILHRERSKGKVIMYDI